VKDLTTNGGVRYGQSAVSEEICGERNEKEAGRGGGSNERIVFSGPRVAVNYLGKGDEAFV